MLRPIRSLGLTEHVMRNDGTGAFDDMTEEWWPRESNPGWDDNGVYALDVDSDGDADFLVGSLDGPDRLLVNDGSGHLTLAADVFDAEPSRGSLGFALADLNGDVRLDVGRSVFLGYRVAMSTIEAHSKPVRELLTPKYSIDYYQREYRWETRQIEELLDDLEASFLESYDPKHDRTKVADYAPYFLGSVVLNQKNGRTYIIDGQQRLTTLTMLLIFLKRLQPSRADFSSLIYSELFGKQSFNLDVPERTDVMHAIVDGDTFDTGGTEDRSVQNIWDRFQDIAELFPEPLQGDALAHFTDWLLSRVILVEIVAFSDDDAYTIFETMNDRGLSLSAAEMLKGYLLANIGSDEARSKSNERWRGRLNELVDFAKEDELDFFKAWLRAKHAESIRERKKGSTNQDFDKIGIGFHKWVRENHDAVGLRKPDDYRRFVDVDFDVFSRYYLAARGASLAPDPTLDSVYFNAQANFTLQYGLMLAPLSREDDPATARHKMRLVASFIEIFIARRAVGYRTLGYSAIVYTMFNLMKDLRSRDIDALRSYLRDRLDSLEESFDAVADFAMHQQNQGLVLLLLARMTDFVESESRLPSSMPQYLDRSRAARYDIEHIWPDTHDRYAGEFPNQTDFARYRNRFGDLLLLPERVNRSLGKVEFSKKRKAYGRQNLLAASLDPVTYQNNPGFIQFVARTGLNFRAYDAFGRKQIDERQELYRELCRVVWDPERLLV